MFLHVCQRIIDVAVCMFSVRTRQQVLEICSAHTDAAKLIIDHTPAARRSSTVVPLFTLSPQSNRVLGLISALTQDLSERSWPVLLVFVCVRSECSGFLPHSKGHRLVRTACRSQCEHAWLFLPIFLPCGELATCPGSSPGLQPHTTRIG